MPIAALSETAARAICSSLALNDSASVIKELVDNALDSNATSITIEISANTLDTIQVKDNGGGIGIEDRQLLCKRGYTSKIRSFEDLAQLGGKYLGFRGEALASIAELSDNLTVTTRVDGETAATFLKFDSKGKLISSSSAAHGTGTTVRVSDFLKSLPVRKQTALKQTAKTLYTIKNLLFDYAFARPTVRFQFKVLKSGSDLKANWSFAPLQDASNLSLLVSKIVGKDIATQCQQTSITSDDGSLTIDALLFARDADISKCAGANCFVSVDGRPLTAERGFVKEVSKIYKSYINDVPTGSNSLPKKIFLLVRLKCPRGSYDVNVEPSKDEIMFEDSHKVLDLFEQMCKTFYGEKVSQPSKTKDASSRRTDVPLDFNILMAKKPQGKTQNLPRSPSSYEDLKATQRQAIPNNLTDDNDARAGEVILKKIGRHKRDLLSAHTENHENPEQEVSDEEDVMDPRVTNPFVLAKINTRIRPQQIVEPQLHSPSRTPASKTTLQRGDAEQSGNNRSPRPLPPNSGLLPSPSPSPDRNIPYQNPGPLNRLWRSRQLQPDEEDGEMTLPVSPQQTAHSTKPSLVEDWARSINSLPQRESSGSVDLMQSNSKTYGKVSTVGRPTVSLSGLTPNSERKLVQPTYRSPFRTPFKKDISRTNDTVNTEMRSSEPRRTTLEDTHGNDVESGSPSGANAPKFPGFVRPRIPSNTELDDIMDFEHRKRSTIMQHRSKHNQQKVDRRLSPDNRADEKQLYLVPSRPENEGLSLADMNSRNGKEFGQGEAEKQIEIPPQPNLASFTQNPHRNRYRKALQDLDDRTAKIATADRESKMAAGPGMEQGSVVSGLNDSSHETQQKAKVGPEDARAYLIRQSAKIQPENGVKQKRSMTARLPFENIVSDAATYAFLGTITTGPIGSHAELSRRAKVLSLSDPYVCEGRIEEGLSAGSPSGDRATRWKDRLERLLTSAGSTMQSET